MNGPKRLLRWYVLLQKRFLKKYSFLLILGMIPLLALGMRLVAKEDKGMLKIVLCAEDDKDEKALWLLNALEKDAGVLQYERMNSPKAAEYAVKTGEADAAWIMREDFARRLTEYASGRWEEAPVEVIEREDNVALQLAREKLYSTLFPDISYALYEHFIREDLGDAEIQEEELAALYERWRVEDSLIRFSVLHDTGELQENRETDYLLSPVRGLLALFVLACGMACAMYYRQDEEEGIFSWMPVRHRWFLEYGYHLIAVTDAMACMLLALLVMGSFLNWKRELLTAGLYCIITAAFCMILRRLCGSIQVLGAAIPILLLGMLVLCPIFLNVRHLQPVRYLLPPFYYLSALQDDQMLLYMGIFCIAIHGCSMLWKKQ